MRVRVSYATQEVTVILSADEASKMAMAMRTNLPSYVDDPDAVDASDDASLIEGVLRNLAEI